RRARISIVVPAVMGTTMGINREGYWACACAGANTHATIARHAAPNLCRLMRRPLTRLAVFVSCCPPSYQCPRAHRRRLRADQLEWKADQRKTILFDPVEVLQIGHCNHAVFAERARIMEDARCARLVVTMIEVVTDNHHALLDAPHCRTDGQIGRLCH